MGDGEEEETFLKVYLSPICHSETQHMMSDDQPKWPFVIILGDSHPQTPNKQAENSQPSNVQEVRGRMLVLKDFHFLRPFSFQLFWEVRRLRERAGTSGKSTLLPRGAEPGFQTTRWLGFWVSQVSDFYPPPHVLFLGNQCKEGGWAAPSMGSLASSVGMGTVTTSGT